MDARTGSYNLASTNITQNHRVRPSAALWPFYTVWYMSSLGRIDESRKRLARGVQTEIIGSYNIMNIEDHKGVNTYDGRTPDTASIRYAH